MKEDKALDNLSQLAEHLAEPYDQVAVCQEMIDLMEQTLGFELSALLVLKPEGGTFEPLALSRQGGDDAFLERDREYVRRRAPSRKEGLTGWVARAGQSVRLGDVRDDPRYYALRDDIRSELCVPLKPNGKVLGVLNTETSRSNAYTPQDQRFLETAATFVGLGIESSRLRGAETKPEQAATLKRAELVSMCSFCEKVSDDADRWWELKTYVASREWARFSHGICPGCMDKAIQG